MKIIENLSSEINAEKLVVGRRILAFLNTAIEQLSDNSEELNSTDIMISVPQYLLQCIFYALKKDITFGFDQINNRMVAETFIYRDARIICGYEPDIIVYHKEYPLQGDPNMIIRMKWQEEIRHT